MPKDKDAFEIGCCYYKNDKLYIAIDKTVLASYYNGNERRLHSHPTDPSVIRANLLQFRVMVNEWEITFDKLDEIKKTIFNYEKTASGDAHHKNQPMMETQKIAHRLITVQSKRHY